MEAEKIGNLNFCTNCDGEITIDSDNDDDDDEDFEFDITTLRELLKIERQKVIAVRAELAKERAASATAAEEAMAMILRLQNEKSLIEMEWSQHRRLAEEKQVHDQEVIRSLKWLVRQHELDRSLKEAEMDECEEAQSSFNELKIEYHDIVRASCTILRLADDMGTSLDEVERGDVPKSIQCYMNEKNASEEEERVHVREIIEQRWEEMNTELMEDDSPIFPKFMLRQLLILQEWRSLYTKMDRMDSACNIQRLINCLLFEPYA